MIQWATFGLIILAVFYLSGLFLVMLGSGFPGSHLPCKSFETITRFSIGRYRHDGNERTANTAIIMSAKFSFICCHFSFQSIHLQWERSHFCVRVCNSVSCRFVFCEMQFAFYRACLGKTNMRWTEQYVMQSRYCSREQPSLPGPRELADQHNHLLISRLHAMTI